jgi:hypothetical protein
MEFEFYSNFTKKEIAKQLSPEIGKKIHVFKKYHSKFVPTREQFKLEPDYSGGSKMTELITGPLPYFEAIPILIRILKWIDENGYTDKKCAFQFGVSFDKSIYPSLPSIESLNLLKFVLGFDEDYIWERFPDRRGSLYAKSIKKITPANKFLSPGKLSYIDKNQYKVPVEKNNGINFTKLKDGYFEVRYLGGSDYQRKYVQIKEVIDHIVRYTHQVLLFNEEFTPTEASKLEKNLNDIYKESSSFIEPELFFKNFPELTVLVDLKSNEQVVRSYFNQIREVLYDVIVENGITRGYLNYDTQLTKFQLKDAESDRVYLLRDMDLIECKLSGNIYNCRLFGCHIDGGNLDNCDLLTNNEIKKSKISKSEIHPTNEIVDSYIDNGEKEINCTVKGGIIRSGFIGNMAFISEETEIVEEKPDGKKKSGIQINPEFKDRNYPDAKKPVSAMFRNLNSKPTGIPDTMGPINNLRK